MAQTAVKLTLEMDLVNDVVADIERIMRALVKCHGQPYRMLERRIEHIMEGEIAWGEARLHEIAAGRFILDPWPELKAVIREARELEVI
jgi:hypothetical protein